MVNAVGHWKMLSLSLSPLCVLVPKTSVIFFIFSSGIKLLVFSLSSLNPLSASSEAFKSSEFSNSSPCNVSKSGGSGRKWVERLSP